jgi:hypothetical protein
MVRYEDEEEEEDKENAQPNQMDLSHSMESLNIDPTKAAAAVGRYGRMSETQSGPSSQPRLRTAIVGPSTSYTSSSQDRLPSTSTSVASENQTNLGEALKSTFRFRDDASGKPYAVVLQDGHLVQISLNGEVGMRLKQGSGHSRESGMRQAYEQSGQRSFAEVVSLLRACQAMQQSSRSQLVRNEDDEGEDDEGEEDDDDVESDASC